MSSSVLASELLLHIFGYFENAAQLCIVSKVNRLWHRVSNDDSLWLDLCLKAGIEVPMDPAAVARHIALMCVAAQQSLVEVPNTLLDMSILPFDEETLWVLCRKTLEGAGKPFPFNEKGQLQMPGNGTASRPADSRFCESNHASSEVPQRGVPTSKKTLNRGDHSWKLMQLPVCLRFAPNDINVILPTGMAQLRVLYASYATLYRGFWDTYPQVKHLSRRLEKWLSRKTPSCFRWLSQSRMAWRYPSGVCPSLQKRQIDRSPNLQTEGTIVLRPIVHHAESVNSVPDERSMKSIREDTRAMNRYNLCDLGVSSSIERGDCDTMRAQSSASHLSDKNPSGLERVRMEGSTSTTLGIVRYPVKLMNEEQVDKDDDGDEMSMDIDERLVFEASKRVDVAVLGESGLSVGSKTEHLQGDVGAWARADVGSYRTDERNVHVNEDIWTFANVQFMLSKTSQSLKELALFYHLFRDGESPITGTPPFGLFGSYLSGDIYVSLEMQPSKHLRIQKLLDLDVLNFATCHLTGKSLSLVVSCSNNHRNNFLWRVVHVDGIVNVQTALCFSLSLSSESSRKYQDYGTFGQFLENYVTNIERGFHSVGASPEVDRFWSQEWYDLLSLGSKLERAIKQRRLILSTQAHQMDEATRRLRQREYRHLLQLLWRLPPPMPVPHYPSSTIPPGSISMLPNSSSGPTMSYSRGVEVRPTTLASMNVSDANRKVYRVRFQFRYDGYDEHRQPTTSGFSTLRKASNDLMSVYEGSLTSPLIDVEALEAALMSSNNSLIDKTTDYHPFPVSHRPFMLNIPTTVALALGMHVSSPGPSTALKTTWELLVMITDFMSAIISSEPKYDPCQLVSRHWRVKYRSGATRVVEGEGVGGHFPKMAVESSFHEYCSYVPDQPSDPCLWIEGKFTFVPGTLHAPTGPPFDVPIPRIIFPISLDYDEPVENRKLV
ncbi:hypothetical protein BJ742DRAFT_790519 [Cladochytrium replicatum]|nr:hypothetical protein BJ742DRAFT_790519 [Cladochytrium replicatum]